MEERRSFFSVRYDLIQVGVPIPYDLFVNSSSIQDKEKFVRIFPTGDVLSKEDLENYHQKYIHLYVSENQRRAYLRSMVQSNADDEKKANVIKSAALDYLNNIFDKDNFSTEYLSQSIEGCKEVVGAMVDVLDNHNIDSLRSLIGNLSFHDFYTYDHSINVSMYCISLYRAAKPNATNDEIVMAGLGGLLHDIGKIKISTDIINKPEKLSDEEFNIIKTHPTFGFELLTENPCECQGVDFNIIKRVVHEHHENFNGTGYPKKLTGNDIHLFARVTAIADFFDAITTKRTYHEVLTTEDAIAVMAKTVGKIFLEIRF